MQLTIIGLVLIGYGALYLRKPTVYRRGIWMKTSIAIRTLSEESYKRYIKGLGTAFILIGIGCVAWDQGLAQFFRQG
jgi:hypothetical protein